MGPKQKSYIVSEYLGVMQVNKQLWTDPRNIV